MRFKDRVYDVIDSYLNAFQIPYSDLSELEIEEREELLNTLMEELAITIPPTELQRLLDKEDLDTEDIVVTLELGEPLDEI